MSFWEPRGAVDTGRFAEVGEPPAATLGKIKQINFPRNSAGIFISRVAENPFYTPIGDCPSAREWRKYTHPRSSRGDCPRCLLVFQQPVRDFTEWGASILKPYTVKSQPS